MPSRVGESVEPLLTRLLNPDARVLVVDDNAVNRRLALALLERLGIGVSEAKNGEEAIAALTAMKYDLVLMDCQMPVMDGFEAARTVRDSSSSVLDHQVPIIAITANAQPGATQKCLAAGMNDYLAKPVDLKRLAGKLEHWLAAEAT